MLIEYRDHITRGMLRRESEKLFVFGDNVQRRGMGGQASAMRGEPNAVGIPTKIRPSMDEASFFSNSDMGVFLESSSADIARLSAHGGVIVWPSAGIGTGRAQLEKRAPSIHLYIEIVKKCLEMA